MTFILPNQFTPIYILYQDDLGVYTACLSRTAKDGHIFL